MATSKDKKQLSLSGAIAIGMASMLGAGVFFVWSSAWELAGEKIFIALLLAGLVACLNAASIYQLASNVSRAGGVYAYSRVYLPAEFSFIAGFAFVVGKIASIAAIALIIQTYLLPDSYIATICVLVLAALNLLGINRTAQMAAIIATATTVFLIFSVTAGFSIGFDPAKLQVSMLLPSGDTSIFTAASIIFFAFAGYARVATLGDEVKDPKKNIPKAIVISLSAVLGLYLLIAVVVVGTINTGNEPMPDAVFEYLLTVSAPWFSPVIIDAVVVSASLGSMLALLAGVSRTAATMAEDRELPKRFAQRNRHGAPWLAEVLIALGAVILIESREYAHWVIAFSSFSVLLYYAIGHLSVLVQPNDQRRQPRFIAIFGLILCAVLLMSVPGPAVLISTVILICALGARTALRGVAKAK